MKNTVELSESQLKRILEALGERRKGPNPYLQILIVPLAVALAGAYVTWRYNVQQETINRTQTMEKFVAYFGKDYSVQQQLAGLTTMVELGYENLAADFLVLTFGDKPSLVRAQVEPFVLAKGLKLLPRLCELTRSGSSASQTAGDYAFEILVKSVTKSAQGMLQSPAFELLENLALGRDAEAQVRQGALLVLELNLSGVLEARVASILDRDKPSDVFKKWPGLEDRLKGFIQSAAAEDERAVALRCIGFVQEHPDPFLREVVQNRAAGDQPRLTALGMLSTSRFKQSATDALLKNIMADRTQPAQLRDWAATAVADATHEKLFERWLLADGSRDDQLVAADGLRRARQENSVPILVKAYNSPRVTDVEVRWRLISGLALFPDSDDAFNLLKTAARSDPDPQTRRAAYMALMHVASTGRRENEVRAAMREGMGDPDSMVLETVLQQLIFAGTADQRQEALDRIGKLQDAELKAALLTLVHIAPKTGR